ncbi:MAG: hypothetical protein GY928_30030 [Colwellia sp.]|nr:hypothetical protein [Colwellia sp.]
MQEQCNRQLLTNETEQTTEVDIVININGLESYSTKSTVVSNSKLNLLITLN